LPAVTWLPLAAEINAFHVLGGLTALWAVILAALGLMRHDFPPKGADKIVMAVSALLVVGTIGAAIGTAEKHEAAGHEEAQETKAGEQGSEAPDEGGTPAPGTGSGGDSAQEPSQNEQTPPGQGTQETLQLNADASQLKFDKNELEGKAGTVNIVMSNPSAIPHNIALEGAGVDEEGPVVQKGGDSEVSATVKAGEYTYYCSVPGHREGGMEGKLTVK
jgi:plastocyanin